MNTTGIGPDLAGAAAGRKLIAVVYADMVGYSQLIGLDDAGTLARLRALRSDLIDPAIGEHGGRIVQTGGDSLLIVFDSIDGAVRCAVKVQEQIPIHDRGAPADRAIRFRVGINIGDTIADGTDLHGDAVNVAVRLQEECPPGVICVSRAVRDHGHDRLHLAFEALGPLKLKNVARPVEAFVLRPAAAPTESPVSGVGLVADGQQWSLPMAPSVAVLPFANFSQDPRWDRLCDGLVEDIITSLARHRDLLVIARHSSFEYKGQSIDVRKIGHALGARYVLEGSVQAESGWLKVTAQLISSISGVHIWAGSYGRVEAEFFAIQDEIVAQVVAALAGFGGAILRAELMGARRKPPASLHAYELYLLGYEQEARLDRNGSFQSIDLLKTALAADPHLSRTWTVLGWAYGNLANNGWTDDVEGARAMQRKAALTALELDPDDSLALVGLAQLRIRERNLIGACEAVERALMAGANHADTLAFLARYVATLLDRPGDAVALMNRSFVLNPRVPAWYYLNHIRVAYFARLFDLVLEHFARLMSSSAGMMTLRAQKLYNALALAQLGREVEVIVAVRELRDSNPDLGIIQIEARSLCPAALELFFDGLRKAQLRDKLPRDSAFAFGETNADAAVTRFAD